MPTDLQLAVPADGKFPLEDVSLAGDAEGGQWLTFLRGDIPESIEAETKSVCCRFA